VGTELDEGVRQVQVGRECDDPEAAVAPGFPREATRPEVALLAVRRRRCSSPELGGVAAGEVKGRATR
jgi:hypothetical protein